MNPDDLKKAAAIAAINYVPHDTVIGVGTGSTVNYFIDALASIKNKIEGVVASSEATAKRIKALGIPLVDLNSVNKLSVYIDGADEINEHFYMVKGGGGALTREKIIAAVAEKFICIAHEGKRVELLGKFPLALEVIPMARSYVARQIVKLGGDPEYRPGFITDNGNIILDVYNLNLVNAIEVEKTLNNIVGVVTCGLFAMRPADILLLACQSGVEVFSR